MNQKQFFPIYMQIAEDIKKSITSHRLPPGSVLPNEIELAGQYGVARATLRNAMNLLEKSGYVTRKKHTGTVVTPDALSKKYKNLDIGFFTFIDLTEPNACARLFQDGWHDGSVLRSGFANGYFMRLFPWQSRFEPDDDQPYYDLRDVVFRKHVDAFVVSAPTSIPDVLDVLREHRVPHVALESHYAKHGVNSVVFDDAASVRDEVRTLYELGHRKIGFLGWTVKRPEINSMIRRCRDAFLAATAELGISVPAHWIQAPGEDDARNTVPDIGGMADALLRNPEARPTAVVVGVQMGVDPLFQAAARHGLRIPHDLSVMCCSLVTQGDVEGQFLDGHRMEMADFTRKVYDELLSWMRHPAYVPKCHCLPKTRCAGATMAPPPRA